LRPVHDWLCQFVIGGDAVSGRITSIRTLFDSERALMIKRWLNRVDEDAKKKALPLAGLTRNQQTEQLYNAGVPRAPNKQTW